MKFDLNKSIDILNRTPYVLEALLSGINDEWLMSNEGENTWSPFEIIGHLIHGDKTDWVTRMEIILSDAQKKNFKPFDRLGQFNASQGKSTMQLLDEFKKIRKQNIEILESKKITSKDLTRKGIHPAFGEVTLEQLLATWTVHDLSHLAQIARVMAKQYKNEVGPWKQYLPILEK